MKRGAALTVLAVTFGAHASVDVLPSWVNFYSVKIGQSQSQLVRVQNYGSVAEQVSISNSCFGDFVVNNWCMISLNPGASCTIDVRFNPRQDGMQNCSIFVGGLNGPSHQVSVSGRGVR